MTESKQSARGNLNVRKGTQGFIETAKAKAAPAGLSGSSVGGGDAKAVVADHLAELTARNPGLKPRDQFISYDNPYGTIVGNVAALEYLEDGTGRQSYMLAARFAEASRRNTDPAPVAAYAQAHAELTERLTEAGIPAPDADLTKALDRFDGYRVTKVHERMGREGMSFDCVLTRDGKAVGDISNDGNGGADMQYFKDKDEQTAFLNRSMLLTTETFEPESFAVGDMMAAAEISRKRAIPILSEGDDFERDGVYRTIPLPKGTDRDKYVERVKDHFRAKGENVRIWDKDKCDLVAV